MTPTAALRATYQALAADFARTPYPTVSQSAAVDAAWDAYADACADLDICPNCQHGYAMCDCKTTTEQMRRRREALLIADLLDRAERRGANPDSIIQAALNIFDSRIKATA